VIYRWSGSRARPGKRLSRWGLIETFVVVQFLSGGLFLLPGAQSVRFVIRALPYLFSGAMTLTCFRRRATARNLPQGTTLLLLALTWLALNLFHPTSQVSAGIAQWVFQACIAAPMFWVGLIVRDDTRLRKILIVTFAANAISATIGLVQIYYPNRFMPGEFSSLALSLNPDYLQALSYEGASGRRIIRPPGLSDVPGGAAIAGFNATLLGLSLGILSPGMKVSRFVYFAGAVVGLVVLYLTEVRALVVGAVIAIGALGILLVRRRRVASLQVMALGSSLVVGSFLLAAMIGGEAMSERFVRVAEEGVVSSYQESRGVFLEDTLSNLLWEFPLGAGVGRWGMMQVYFGDYLAPSAVSPIHVEIQLTGWLLDGGVVMWVLYGGAIILAMLYALPVAASGARGPLADLAAVVLCIELSIVGVAMVGPAFNAPLGIEFWMLAAALHGAASGRGNERTRHEDSGARDLSRSPSSA
jgi:hypothetical protein